MQRIKESWAVDRESVIQETAIALTFQACQFSYADTISSLRHWQMACGEYSKVVRQANSLNSGNRLAFAKPPLVTHTFATEQENESLDIAKVSEDPLDQQFGIWRQRMLPDNLRHTLFAQSSEQFKANCYVNLNAQCIQFLDSLLGFSRGEYSDSVKSCTPLKAMVNLPWRVKLAPDQDFTYRLFSSSPKDRSVFCYSQKKPAIYLRTTYSFKELVLHLGRFFRVTYLYIYGILLHLLLVGASNSVLLMAVVLRVHRQFVQVFVYGLIPYDLVRSPLER